MMMINSTQLASFFTKFTKELDQETEFFLCHKLNKGKKKKETTDPQIYDFTNSARKNSTPGFGFYEISSNLQ